MRGDLATAEKEFRGALEYDPGEIATQNHLAVVCFESERFAEAAQLWATVLDTARREAIELPEPVHVNRAKALHRSGDRAAAEAELDRYLAEMPAGRWAAVTRSTLTWPVARTMAIGCGRC